MSDGIKLDSRHQRAIAQILRSSSSDLNSLMRIADGDRSTFYVGANLTGLDLRGQNLTGIDFLDADLSKVLINAKTEFDHRAYNNPTLRIDFLEVAAEALIRGSPRKVDPFLASAGYLVLSSNNARAPFSRSGERSLIDEGVISAMTHFAKEPRDLYFEARKEKALLTIGELTSFARFISDKPWSATEHTEENFRSWQRKKMRAQDRLLNDHLGRLEELPTEYRASRFTLVEVLHFLEFMTGPKASSKRLQGYYEVYKDQVDEHLDPDRPIRTGR